jgi:hypothetical protein
VLNPAVAQEVADKDKQEDALKKSLGMLMLTKQIEQQSPEYQAKVEALKNEKAFREAVGSAGGDMTKIAGAAIQYGKPEIAMNFYNQQETRAARAQEALRAHDLKMATLAQNHELALQRITDVQARQAETERHNKAIEAATVERNAIAATAATAQQEIKKLEFQMKGDKDLVKRTRQLQGDLEKANLPEADAVLLDVEKAIRAAPEVAQYLSGPKSLLPDVMVPDNVKSARQSFQKLFNITLKNRSGAAVTNQELERLKNEFATGAFKTEKQIRDAVEKARGIINKHYASVVAGSGKDVLEAYNENIRSFGGRVVLEAGEAKEDPLNIR